MKLIKYYLAAIRGRVRSKDKKWTQVLEITDEKISHALTSVYKDNMVVLVYEKSDTDW